MIIKWNEFRENKVLNHSEIQKLFFNGKVCKTQNSGLCSKEEKPRDPINQSSRCNTQEGLLTVAQTG